jgi:hypothetical protein
MGDGDLEWKAMREEERMRRGGGNCQRSRPSIPAHYLPFVCTVESCLTQQCKQMGDGDLEWKAMREEERMRRGGGNCQRSRPSIPAHYLPFVCTVE